jgi:flavodoxin I
MASTTALLLALLPLSASFSFVPTPSLFRTSTTVSTTSLDAVGIFFGTSTGNTEDVATALQEAYPDSEGPFAIEDYEGGLSDAFEKYDGLIVGAPTWNTGAKKERSGTPWDELYYGEMADLKLEGKNVAVFGLGDMASYGANYADASGELFEVFEGLGCKMFGLTDVDDSYTHKASKAQRGDKFVGLMCDQMNQDDLTDERIEKWLEQLQAEGFASGGGGGSAPAAAAPKVVKVAEVVAAKPAAAKPAAKPSAGVTSASSSNSPVAGYKAYYNPVKKSTMYVDKEGTGAYVVDDE